MSEFILPEQDVINSICLFYAREKHILPEDVEVELLFEDDRGFEAEVYANGAQTLYNEGNMISAVRLWIEEYHDLDPYATGIRLELDDEQGIIAYINA
ncbi:MAG: DUF2653 family protein [Kurthia sp.]|nr:DUF2653 family protein [Candidatus Kurthia equi]